MRFDRTTLICAAGIAGASLLAAFLLLPRFHDFFFVWDHNFGSAVSYACGHGLAEFQDPVPTLADFLNRRRADFDCAVIPATVRFGPLNAYASGIPYFLRGIGLYWRLTGVSWQALAPLFGVLFAISNTLVFLLFSEFLGTALGGALALVYVFTPSNYYSLTHYEHYAKTPLFLASVLIMVWLARHRVSFRQLIAASVVGGVLIGFGFGVRADLWLLSVLFAATVIFFTGRELGRGSRCLACLVFLITCTAVALPALLTQGTSYFWLQLLQGLSSPFDADLSVRRAIYEWVPLYSDNLADSWMQTHAYFQVDGGTVAAIDGFTGGSGPAPGMISWQAREAAGMSGYLAIMRHFPADFVTRPLAAVLEILRESFGTQATYAAQFGAAPNFFTRTQAVWSFLSAVSIVPVCALLAGIVGLAVHDRRQAAFCLTAVLYLGGMTAIVFIPRHRWHLYFIGLLVVGIAGRFLFQEARDVLRSGRNRSHHRAGLEQAGRLAASVLPFVLLIAGLATSVIVVTRAWQHRTVGRLVEQLLAANKEPVRLSRPASGNGPVILEATDLIERFRVQAEASHHFQYAHYLMATFSRERCPAEARVRALYRASQPFFDDTRDVALDFRDGSASFDLIFPAYDVQDGSNFGYFRGLELTGAADDCVTRLARFRDPAALPFLITWHLPEHWQAAPRHQAIIFAGR